MADHRGPDRPPSSDKLDTNFDPYEVGRRAVELLKAAEGGSISHDEAAARLGISLTDLRQLLKQRKIVAWTDPEGLSRFPVWQFDAGGILPGIADCLEVLPADDWEVMRFFLAQRESMGCRSALSFLRDGNVGVAKEMAMRSSLHP